MASCDPTGVAESGSKTRNGPEPVETPEGPSESTGSDPSTEGASDGDSPSTAAQSVSGSMERRSIPGTDETLPVVGLGTWQQFDVPANSDRLPRLQKVLQTMIDLKGEVVDTSPMYGRAERTIGTLLDRMGVREQFFLATKVWTRGKRAGIEQMEASMRKMGADTLDLIQVHNLLDWETHLETLEHWKEEGRVRYIGITHYTTGSLSRLADVLEARPSIDFVQFAYSIETRAAEQRLLDVADEQNVATIVNRPFEGGRLFARAKGRELPAWVDSFGCRTWAQYFLTYILGDPRITCVIPGTSDPEHAADNLRAGYGGFPNDEQRQRMVDAWRQ